jgi:glutamate racemase
MLAPSDAIPTYNFFSTGEAKAFEVLAKRFLGPEVAGVKHLERKVNLD